MEEYRLTRYQNLWGNNMSTSELAACIGRSNGKFRMTSDSFRTMLRRRLESASDRVLLRVLVSRRDSDLVELTGPELCERSIELARKYCQAPPSGVVLVLLPHSLAGR